MDTTAHPRTLFRRLAAWLFAGLAAVAAALSVVTLSVAIGSSPKSILDDSIDADTDLVLFWGEDCPKCEEELAWLETVVAEHPDLDIAALEVKNDPENRELFVATGDDLGFTASSWPVTVTGERVWIGWTGPIQEDISDGIDLILDGKTPPPGVYGTSGAGTCSEDLTAECSAEEPVVVDVPVLGEVSLGDKSLVVSTLIIGFVDGVNPCSLWVISILLTIVIRTASRRRVIAIGSTFLLVTSAMYALYMASAYTALSVAGFIGKIQLFVAIVAGFFGLVSVKDYFAFKEGLSFTIKDSQKPGIYKRVRDAAGHHALIPALAATIALAVAVSLIETPCTAGFPVIWIGLLKDAGIGAVGTAVLFVLYMIPFLLDEMIVFGIAVVTMRASKLQEKHGEILKLVAGETMLALAATMVFAPEVMENPIGALAVFGAAFGLAWAIHFVTTKVRASRTAVEATAVKD